MMIAKPRAFLLVIPAPYFTLRDAHLSRPLLFAGAAGPMDAFVRKSTRVELKLQAFYINSNIFQYIQDERGEMARERATATMAAPAPRR